MSDFLSKYSTPAPGWLWRRGRGQRRTGDNDDNDDDDDDDEDRRHTEFYDVCNNLQKTEDKEPGKKKRHRKMVTASD